VPTYPRWLYTGLDGTVVSILTVRRFQTLYSVDTRYYRTNTKANPNINPNNVLKLNSNPTAVKIPTTEQLIVYVK